MSRSSTRLKHNNHNTNNTRISFSSESAIERFRVAGRETH